jgi:hypothetical protein
MYQLLSYVKGGRYSAMATDGPSGSCATTRLSDYEPTRYVDVLPPNYKESEKMLLQTSDVVRYARDFTS